MLTNIEHKSATTDHADRHNCVTDLEAAKAVDGETNTCLHTFCLNNIYHLVATTPHLVAPSIKFKPQHYHLNNMSCRSTSIVYC